MAKRGRKPKGLGDTVEQITKATGIKAVVDKISEVTGIDCGCEGRKDLLNRLIPYRKEVNCINENDFIYLQEFFKQTSNYLSIKQQTRLTEIYKNVFSISLESTSCSSCWRTYISELRTIYNKQNEHSTELP